MRDEKLLPLFIQLFADEEGSAANEPEDAGSTNADSTEDVINETEDVTADTQDSEVTNDEQDTNSREVKKSTKDYSERLNADRERIRQEIEKEQNDKLDRIAKSRGFENWQELEEFSNKEQLENLGVTDAGAFEKYLNNIIENNPDIVRAKAIIAEQQARDSQRQLEEQVLEIGKLDPSIKSVNDLIKHPSYDNILERVKKGSNVLDAYKLENFDALTGRTADAAVQHAYNNINNKSHVKTTTGGTTKDTVVPTDVYAMYKRNLPSWSDEQIKKHYAKEIGEE